jgi:hypothetical protein
MATAIGAASGADSAGAWSEFWRPFLLSPGAAAVAALLAAIIAFLAASRSTKAARSTAREEQEQRDIATRQEKWWAATMWAADHSVSSKTAEAALGYRALEALQASGWPTIDESQTAFIRALTDNVLHEAGVVEARTNPRQTSVQALERRREVAIQLTHGPEVYVAAARTRVTSNRLLGITSSEKLLRLADGDISVLPEQREDGAESEPESPQVGSTR